MTKEDFIMKENVKTNIRSFRERNNYTQTQLAAILGTNRSTYTKWESGDSMPSIIQISKLAAIYGRSVDDFYKQDSGFTVATPLFDRSGELNYISKISNDERMLLAQYRLLSDEDKRMVDDLIESLKNKQ